MATGTRTTDTFTEGLRKVLGDVQDLKTTDDADLPFIINMETTILQRLKQAGSDALQGTQPPQPMPMPGPPGMGSPGAMMAPGMAAGPPPGPGAMMAGPGLPPGMGPTPGLTPAPVPGLMAGNTMPNPDELRRILTTGQTAYRLNNVANKLSGLK